MKSCPNCGQQYPDDALVCTTDNYVLITQTKLTDSIRKNEGQVAIIRSEKRPIRLIRDFVFGVLAISVTPLIAYLGFALVWTFLCVLILPLFSLFVIIAPTVSLGALIFVLRWRWNHRLVHFYWFPVEVILGVALAVAGFIGMITSWRLLGP